MNGCRPEDPDSPMMQEILLPGHLFLGVLAVSKTKKNFITGLILFSLIRNVYNKHY